MSRTPQTWPEATRPTPSQAADWLAICTDEERLHAVERMMANGDAAVRCINEGHDHLRDENAWLHRELIKVREQLAKVIDRYSTASR